MSKETSHKQYFYVCSDCNKMISSRLDTIKNMRVCRCRSCSNIRKGRDNREKIKKSTLDQMNNGNWKLNSLTKEQEEKRVRNFRKTMKNKYKTGELVPWNKGITGKNSHMWIEDRNKLKEPLNQQIRGSSFIKKFRMKCMIRDEYACQYCHTKGGMLNVHHIKSFAEYPEYRFDVDNGITLCEQCHRWVHSIEPRNQQ